MHFQDGCVDLDIFPPFALHDCANEQEARCSLVHFLPDAEVGGSGRAGVGELHDSLLGGKAVFRVLSLDWTRDICIMLKHGFVIRKT